MQSLKHHNTFGIDKSCEQIFEPTTTKELISMLSTLRERPLLVIGEGSNLLLTQDFAGYVLHPCIMGIGKVDSTEQDREHAPLQTDDVLVRCGAGENWDEVVDYTIQGGLFGMENLSLIPGEVGASAVQNIGAYGMEVKDLIYKLEAVEIATGKEYVFYNDACDYSYRYSRFKGEWKGRFVITYVTYRLSRRFTPRLEYGNLQQVLRDMGIAQPSAKAVRNAVINIRRAKLPDPKEHGNAGSFFVNPIISVRRYEELLTKYPNMPCYETTYPDTGKPAMKIPAAWLIEQCGWKGKNIGRAGVYAKQPLILVNLGGATGEEILRLCNAIQWDVKAKFDINLTPEVNII